MSVGFPPMFKSEYVKISLISLTQLTHAWILHMHYWKAAYEYWQLLMTLNKKRQGSSWWEGEGKDKRTRRNHINIKDVIQSPTKPIQWFILTSEVMRDGVWKGREQISGLMVDVLFLQMFYNRGHDVYSKIIICKKRVIAHFVSF